MAFVAELIRMVRVIPVSFKIEPNILILSQCSNVFKASHCLMEEEWYFLENIYVKYYGLIA